MSDTSHRLTIAVLGANGRLGSSVACAAAARGHHVIAVTRTGRLAAEVAGAPGRPEPRAADALQAGSLAGAIRGADVVVNALNPVYTDWPKTVRPMARNVIAACAATGAHHLFPGNVYNYGAGMPAVLRADTPQVPTARKGVIRRDVEALLRQAAAEGRVRTTILRAGDFYGGPRPGGSWFDLAVASRLGKGRFVYPGPMDLPHAWAYLPDLARAFVALAEAHAALPDFADLGFAGHVLTGARMKALLEGAAGRPLKPARFPWTAIRALSLVHPMSREIAEMAYLWSTPHALDGADLEALIGALPQTPPEAAVAGALAAMQAVPKAA
ncbi:NAD(P)H-binding protein [Pseudooceanicola sp. CBS1P-1]|uniref:NAD(P)H-binding protein n=1 Tax=Pseudooceanicola albus TaxID=2692189 RepID=A0A6L7G7A4_9RHOB|nr:MULTISPECIES: NAD(P)H-binding protein [Pseudooceanicola]MBT9383002.1 NAD(P)H-binding protein [Pseudooceanicola endophyticus]MXN19190.1 NAD(P)H-binding protein [Pseudooceanicola albus]